ncbi:hypothetical protein XNA1_2950002 [Xenorhabdus nematophila str. Anatoliense]|nr:hypothetical protein XNA1_1730002 [Xenorhabdus nematophila str. Anatoliense]CEE92521.1 hypothetical protein XNA1_2950002 [Xenorhabdus nematophila str. Anatoliense]
MMGDRHNDKSIHSNMVFKANNQAKSGTCGFGYVVGVWANANPDNLHYEWAVWLSETGRSWSNKDVKIYWAYDKLVTDNNIGKSAYAIILAAQASGQEVIFQGETAEASIFVATSANRDWVIEWGVYFQDGDEEEFYIYDIRPTSNFYSVILTFQALYARTGNRQYLSLINTGRIFGAWRYSCYTNLWCPGVSL